MEKPIASVKSGKQIRYVDPKRVQKTTKEILETHQELFCRLAD